MRLRPFEVDEIMDVLYGPLALMLTASESTLIGGIRAWWTIRRSLTDAQDRALIDVWQRVKSSGVRPSEFNPDQP